MIKLIICLILILELKKTVDAAVAILPPQEKPKKYEHREGCYVPELDKVLRYDKPYSPADGKSCLQYTCNKDGYTYIYSCGALGAGEDCWIVPGNRYRPYPKCCNTIKCKKQPDPVKPVDTDDPPVDGSSSIETPPVLRSNEPVPVAADPPVTQDPCAPPPRSCPPGDSCIDPPPLPVC